MMKERKDSRAKLVGRKFHHLTVTGIAEPSVGTRHGKFWVHCDCGREKATCMSSIGRIKTCSKQCPFNTSGHRTHGLTYDPITRRTYKTWAAIKDRCNNTGSKDYASYGGRGIVVCDRWLHDFPAFLSDMGVAPVGKSIDRKDNDGPYSPDNCKWSTPVEQQNNRRSNTVVLVHGMPMTLEYAKLLVKDHNRLIRLKRRTGSWQKAFDLATA